jgi:ribose/xylose/arabinose/galactoside ABC-type transport system permease subunit
LIAFVVFMIGFTIANERFLAPENVMGVVRSSAILGVMALGVTFVVISGNLDLSVGSMMSFSTIVVLDLHDKIGPALAIPAMFAMTLCLGAFIGFLVGYLKLNSLIVTLGMLSAIHGLTLTYSGGKNMDIANKDDTWFAVFGQGSALGHPGADPDLRPVAAVLGMVLAKTPFGRKVYAVGGNGRRPPSRASAGRASCSPDYLLSAFCVATAGLIQASRSLGARTPWARGWSSRFWPPSSSAAHRCSAGRARSSRQ